MAQRVVVVTDSSAMLPASVARDHGIVVVPLHVIIGSEELEEGQPGTSPEQVAAALTAKKSVSTSRPSPASLSALYRRLASEGVGAIVAVHLSSEMSGTVESAQLAARDAPIAVLVVDSRAVGPSVGFAALAAADALARGASAFEAAERARARAEATASYFYVDTLEYLRRGGRIGTAAALLGSALAVKPLLTVEGGHVVAHERVRTSGRALARLEELAVEAVDAPRLEVVVAHVSSPDRAEALAARLTERFDGRLVGAVRVGEIGAALAAHVGPGMIAACVTPGT
jgi:DegV family protein with EDD domain